MTTTTIAIAAAIAIGLSTIAPAIAQGLAASKALEGMARQPEVAGEIRTTMILALAFMEALTIYGLLVAILLVNKL
ncbi:MAG: ATP synthase F0 subunit C [Eubacteriales Family XIII. Incertae Sedis bacterium]|nr:MAG: ATP synthase F0 subunit C [Clostridiales Family XIII bacterium]